MKHDVSSAVSGQRSAVGARRSWSGGRRLALVAFLAAFCLLQIALGILPAFAQQLVVPSDQFYGRQWALEKIGAECAWQHTTGSQAVTVAVIDSGVDMGHPELRDHLRSDGYDFVD